MICFKCDIDDFYLFFIASYSLIVGFGVFKGFLEIENKNDGQLLYND